MKLSETDVQKIATLARLDLTLAEVEMYREQLSAILDYVKQLQQLDTSGITATAQVTGLTNVLADDTVVPQDSAALRNGVPQASGESIKVRAVFGD